MILSAVRSVTHSLPSGPQVISQGFSRPEATTRMSKRFVATRADSGPVCANASASVDAISAPTMPIQIPRDPDWSSLSAPSCMEAF